MFYISVSFVSCIVMMFGCVLCVMWEMFQFLDFVSDAVTLILVFVLLLIVVCEWVGGVLFVVVVLDMFGVAGVS